MIDENSDDLSNFTKLMYDDAFEDMLREIGKIHQRSRSKINNSELVLNKLTKNNRFKDKINTFLENSSELDKILFNNMLLDKELFSGLGILENEDMLDYEDADDDDEPNEFESVTNQFVMGEEPLDLTPEEIKEEDEEISKIFLDDYKTLVCDLDLPGQILEMYEVGQYLYHPTFLFASEDEKFCKANCRFKIYSSGLWTAFNEIFPDEITDDEDISVNTITQIFKVIDIYEKDGKTQITLLNVPAVLEYFSKMHALSVEDKFVKETRDGFDESFSCNESMDSANFKFSPLAIGIYESVDGYSYFTKSDMFVFLAIFSNISDYIDQELLNEIMLKYDISKLFNQYNKLESIRNLDDEHYTVLHSVKFSEALTVEYSLLFMKTCIEIMTNLFGFVEDKMDSLVLGDS